MEYARNIKNLISKIHFKIQFDNRLIADVRNTQISCVRHTVKVKQSEIEITLHKNFCRRLQIK